MLVEFTLTEEDENTRLRVLESGLRELDWTEKKKAEFLDDHAHGWEHHFGELNRCTVAQRATAR